MPNPAKLFAEKINARLAEKADDLPRYPAVIGDGYGHVYYGSSAKVVYVRVGNQVHAAICKRVSPENNKAVWVGWANEEKTIYQVLSYRNDASDNGIIGGGYAPANRYRYLARGGGQDPLWLELRAWLPLRVGMTSPASMSVSIYSGNIWSGTEFLFIPAQSIDLTSHIPSTTGKAAWVLITVDDTGSIVDTKGSEVDIDVLSTSADVFANAPAIPAGTIETLAIVRVYYGQTEVREGRGTLDGTGAGFTDFIDLRGIYSSASGGGLTNPVDYIDFDLTPSITSPQEGRVYWNIDEGTLNIGMPGGDVNLQVGQEIIRRVYNDSGADMYNGQIVYIAGSTGAKLKIALAKADAAATCSPRSLYMLTEDIADNHYGYATWWGDVHDVNTNGMSAGSVLYLSASTAGAFTTTPPDPPNFLIKIGGVLKEGTNNGIVTMSQYNGGALTDINDMDVNLPTTGDTLVRDGDVWKNMPIFPDTSDPTGWVDGNNIDVAYDATTRKITLTGDLSYYWQGVKKSLISPWTSDPHTDANGRYFLYTTDGTTFSWSTDAWAFTDIMVAVAKKTTGYSFGLRETHELMPHTVHEELHLALSSIRYSGGGLTAGTYTENTASDAATTPGFDAMVVMDEDLKTTIAAWTQGTYTTMRIGAGALAVFDDAASFPFRSSGSYILVNNPTTGAETAATNNQYVNVYAIRIPVTSDTASQKFRLVCLQPQRAYSSLASAQAEDVRGLSLGDLAATAPEFVFYERITYVLASGNSNTGKCRIASGGVTYIYGTRMSQISASATPNAENISFTPAGNIVATNVQAAIEEVNINALEALQRIAML